MPTKDETLKSFSQQIKDKYYDQTQLGLLVLPDADTIRLIRSVIAARPNLLEAIKEGA